MKFTLTIFLFVFTLLSAQAQKQHIKQSQPFENVLLAMQTDSASLFMESFTERIVEGEGDLEIWLGRLLEGKEKFAERFGDYQLSDFTYAFDKKESRLLIYYKGEQIIKMKVVKEEGEWKLDEK